MNDREYEDAMRRERERIDETKRDLDLIGKEKMGRITKEYESSKGGHGGAIAGVVILLVLGIAAWMYLS